MLSWIHLFSPCSRSNARGTDVYFSRTMKTNRTWTDVSRETADRFIGLDVSVTKKIPSGAYVGCNDFSLTHRNKRVVWSECSAQTKSSEMRKENSAQLRLLSRRDSFLTLQSSMHHDVPIDFYNEVSRVRVMEWEYIHDTDDRWSR